MSGKKIAIQGELGAYSHIAAENLYAGAEIKTCTTFEETFKQAYNDQNYKIKRFNIWKPIRRIQKARYLKKIVHTNKVEAIFADSWKSIESINFTFNRIIVLAHGTEIPKKECKNFNGIIALKLEKSICACEKNGIGDATKTTLLIL